MGNKSTDNGRQLEKAGRIWDGHDSDDGETSTQPDGQQGDMEPEEETLPPSPPDIPGTVADDKTAVPSSRTVIEDMQPLYKTRSQEFYLMWLVAVLAYGVGDTLTTGVILLVPTLDELNLLVGIILGQFGLAGFVGVKLAVFAVLIYISVKGALDGDTVSYYAPPSLAILLGTALTLWNLATILGL